jgi:arylsulfatase A-like enzyme/Flp pilus assembly protein TadD
VRPRLLAAAGALAAAAACRQAPATAPLPHHVVIVTIDTLRADRLGCYGGSVPTPNLDRLAAEGALVPEATAHVPLTRPSHVTLFTGRLPFEHGIRDNVSPAVVPDTPLLAESFRKAGFTTAAFISSVVLASESGLDRGFDVYSDRFEGARGDAQFLNTVQKRGDVTLGEALAWLEANAARRMFAWIHLYDPHDPYEPPEPYATRYAGRPYDGEVAWSDELIGRLDAALARLGIAKDTLLVVSSDHGEGLGEHDESLHGFFAYQTTLRVPLLMRGPGIRASTRLAATATLADLFPTILELAGLPSSETVSGRSLAPELRGGTRPAEPVVYAETLVPLLHFGWSDLRVVREGRYKYIQAPRPELYDLETDPGERTNLAEREPRRAEAMRTALGRFLDLERARSQQAPAQAASTELIEKLGALGYVGGGGAATTRTPGADPKDKIEEFRIVNSLIREALLAFHAGEHAESARKLRGVLARGVESFEVHYYLARALLASDRPAEAAPHFRAAVERQASHAAAWEGLADCRARLRDPKGAIAVLREGQQALPADAGLRFREARMLKASGDTASARRAYESALPLAPKDARIRVELGELLRDAGAPVEAIRHLQSAVELAPDVASYWNSLGMLLGAESRSADAEKAFREAVRLDGANHRYAYNLGLILQRQGRAAEARPYFEQALRLDPSFAPARERMAELGRRGP